MRARSSNDKCAERKAAAVLSRAEVMHLPSALESVEHRAIAFCPTPRMVGKIMRLRVDVESARGLVGGRGGKGLKVQITTLSRAHAAAQLDLVQP